MTDFSTRTVESSICYNDALGYHNDEHHCFECVARTNNTYKDVCDINNSRERTFRLLPTSCTEDNSKCEKGPRITCDYLTSKRSSNHVRPPFQSYNQKTATETEPIQSKTNSSPTDNPLGELKLPVIKQPLTYYDTIHGTTHTSYNRTNNALNKCASRINSQNWKCEDDENKDYTMLPSISSSTDSTDTDNSFETVNHSDTVPVCYDEVNTETMRVSRDPIEKENSNANSTLCSMQLNPQNQTHTVLLTSERHTKPGSTLRLVQHANSNNSRVAMDTKQGLGPAKIHKDKRFAKSNVNNYNSSTQYSDGHADKGASTMPFNVEQLLEASANDADEQIYKQRWRTGLEAYNDVEEIGLARREDHMAKANALMKSPALNKMISRKKNEKSKHDVSDKPMPKTSIAPIRRATMAIFAPINVDSAQHVPVGNTMSIKAFDDSHAQGLTMRNTSSTQAPHPKPSKSIMDVVISLMDEHKRPKKGCRSLERRDALFGLDQILFEMTFKISAALGCPQYVVEGYNRAAESIRFNVPSDFSLLETMTPLEYLSRHTVVDKTMKDSYVMRFRMFKKDIQMSEGRYTQAYLFQAMSHVFYDHLGKHNFKLIEACVFPEEDLETLTQGAFIGICAFTERCFWRMFNNIYYKAAESKIGCRPYLEYLDFRLLQTREGDINMSVRMRTVLKSLS